MFQIPLSSFNSLHANCVNNQNMKIYLRLINNTPINSSHMSFVSDVDTRIEYNFNQWQMEGRNQIVYDRPNLFSSLWKLGCRRERITSNMRAEMPRQTLPLWMKGRPAENRRDSSLSFFFVVESLGMNEICRFQSIKQNTQNED